MSKDKRSAMRLVLLCLVFLASCSLSAGDKAAEDDTVYRIDFGQDTLVVPVDVMPQAESNRFVFVEITAVENPEVLPLAFSVSYNDGRRKTVRLGDFALFPGNNPGKFIVPTQGKVGTTGSILIRMLPQPQAKDAGSVSVEIRRVRFIDTL